MTAVPPENATLRAKFAPRCAGGAHRDQVLPPTRPGGRTARRRPRVENVAARKLVSDKGELTGRRWRRLGFIW